VSEVFVVHGGFLVARGLAQIDGLLVFADVVAFHLFAFLSQKRRQQVDQVASVVLGHVGKFVGRVAVRVGVVALEFDVIAVNAVAVDLRDEPANSLFHPITRLRYCWSFGSAFGPYTNRMATSFKPTSH
jgi:hypothetical protein